MKVTTMIFEHGNETVLVEVDPTQKPLTIRVPDSAWFMSLLDTERPIPLSQEPLAPVQQSAILAGAARAETRVPRMTGKMGGPGKARYSVTLRSLAHPERDLPKIYRALDEVDARLTSEEHRLLSLRFPKVGEPTMTDDIVKLLGYPNRSAALIAFRRALRKIDVTVARRSRRSRHAQEAPRKGTRSPSVSVTDFANSDAVRLKLQRVFADDSGDAFGLSRDEYTALRLRFAQQADGRFVPIMQNREVSRRLGSKDASGSVVSRTLRLALERIAGTKAPRRFR